MDSYKWATSQTRPDASFDSCGDSNYGRNPKVKNLLKANKVVTKLQFSTLRLINSDLGNIEYLNYCVQRRDPPQGAYIVFLYGNNRVLPITWKSNKLESD